MQIDSLERADLGADSGATIAARWPDVQAALRAQLGGEKFDSWFGRLDLTRIEGATAYLSVPTRFLKSWLHAHYSKLLIAALAEAFPGVASIDISLRGARSASTSPLLSPSPERPASAIAPQAEVCVSAGPAPHAAAPASTEQDMLKAMSAVSIERDFASPLDPRLTFETFAVSACNQLAQAAARTLQSKAGQAPLYNPLYIHAPVGFGKTHLLQAIAHQARRAGGRPLYMTAERFMYGFAAALKGQAQRAFRDVLRGVDLLLIDDLQFLQGKTLRQELCQTIIALLDERRQIVLAANCKPAELEGLDDHLRSRLSGGLCVEIGAMDENLRARILEARIAAAQKLHPAFIVSDEIKAYVAAVITGNGRDLDGAVNRLLAHTCLTNVPLTLEAAELAVRDLVTVPETKRVKIEEVQRIVAQHYDVSRNDILSSRRTANVVRPRQIAMYLAKVLTLRSLPEIGRRFGGRDHTTVLHAVRKMESIVAKDQDFAREMSVLRAMICDA